ncbi:MAG: redoxin domain-containing protein [Verrucomicrobiota bacterium]
MRIFSLFRFLTPLAISCLYLQAEESALPDMVENVSLSVRDLNGEDRMPFRMSGEKAAVLLFVTQDCPISNAYAPEYARLKNEYDPKGFKLTLVYVDPDVSDERIREHMSDFSLSAYQAIADREHRLVEELGATVTPEAVVVLPDGTIAYRGRIDNMYPALGQRRRVITEKDLRNALDSIGDGRAVYVSRTRAVGCYVPNLP